MLWLYWQREIMANEDTNYLSFLLRLWLANDDGEPTRRVSIESPLTGERKGFANLEDLCSYLQYVTDVNAEDVYEETGSN